MRLAMETQRRRRDRALQNVARRVGEPVLAAGIFTRAGALAVDEARPQTPLARLAGAFRGKGPERWLPHEFVLAVTATKVHAFRYPDETADQIAAWERSAVRACSRPGGATGVIFTLESEGDRQHVECTGRPEDIEAIADLIG
jgi:hypothetical protein